MKEILPHVFHWKTFHEGIRAYVHSYYVNAGDTPLLIDPRVPAAGIEWFVTHGAPRHAYLTNRHHYRHSDRFAARYGTEVWCHRAGLHEFTRGEKVRAFEHGDALPGGVLALQVAALCPEETALCLPVAGGVLSIGDAVVRDGAGKLAFVPDGYMGDDPEAVKQGLREAFARHLRERDFDHLLFAHGAPWVGGGHAALARFVAHVEA
jgi:hypothetical protein